MRLYRPDLPCRQLVFPQGINRELVPDLSQEMTEVLAETDWPTPASDQPEQHRKKLRTSSVGTKTTTHSRQGPMSESNQETNPKVRLHAWTELEEILPPLSKEEVETLRSSISANGVMESVKVLRDGRVIDGLHRWRLSDGKAPVQFLQVDEKVGFELALQLNLHRRHLSYEQKLEILRELRRRRYSYTDIRKFSGLSIGSISQILNVDGLRELGSRKFRNENTLLVDLRVKIPKTEYAKISERAKTESQTRIAADYKITKQRVSRF